MKNVPASAVSWLSIAILILSFTEAGAEEPLRPGVETNLGAHRVILQRLDTLPFIESDYTSRHRFDSWDNPKLSTLRNTYRLNEVVASGGNEFEQQLLLMNWVHHQFGRFGHPSVKVRGALEILNAVREGHTFFCSQYAEVLVSCAASLGWINRPLALRRHQGVAKVGGSTEHSVTEIWSNQHRKWIMLDPTSNMYLEKDGVPLNAQEIRQEWFYHQGTNLGFVIGPEQKRFRKRDLPVHVRSFPGFGDLTVQPDELDKYGFIGFIPNNDLMDAGFDYAKMFIVKDALCDGTSWHVRAVPSNPATDPYFPLGQAELRLYPLTPESIRIDLQSFTPNFKTFELRTDDEPWVRTENSVIWKLRPGTHQIKARSLNRFGVTGPVSTAVVKVRSISE